ncbi:phosphate acyltransferase PlsX [Fimbriiglobus ruber]|uniref:Phosphate acyltransferase n=1 Tax=Fimbriiglobus ruber TaxID=1908690 RepID=A0A225DZW7_9BACT|nr:phosphate acyltransferase PlsX [Fimbriiglobus ruber]OWK45114.1 Phosphate:acyl-ACP acyltransferase PlsX [Fimbriiglobus ruber]
MRIALDAMGGDHGLAPNIAGALRAVAAAADLTVVLVGDEAQIGPALAAAGTYPTDRIEVVHSAGVIGMTEKPVEAFRKKPDNTIAQSWKLVATKKVDGLVSAGNTGAVVAGGLFTKRFLKGIRKPGIAAVMPNAKGRTVILDVGANVFPKPSHLLQYGVMGSVYAKHMLGVERPTIGLMNVGEEEVKGHDLVRQTYELFRNSPLNDRFIGNVEGRDIHRGACDVIVTDGFVGNVLLKQAEGLFEFVMGLIAKDVVGALTTERETAAKAVKQLVGRFHHSAAGGAPLLGVDGVCVICHGSSDDRAIANALATATQNVRVRLNDRIVEELATLPDLGEE